VESLKSVQQELADAQAAFEAEKAKLSQEHHDALAAKQEEVAGTKQQLQMAEEEVKYWEEMVRDCEAAQGQASG